MAVKNNYREEVVEARLAGVKVAWSVFQSCMLLFIVTILPVGQVQDVIGIVTQRQELVQEVSILFKLPIRLFVYTITAMVLPYQPCTKGLCKSWALRFEVES